jgi:hypothetical protein
MMMLMMMRELWVSVEPERTIHLCKLAEEYNSFEKTFSAFSFPLSPLPSCLALLGERP